ncbi:MAG: hypothetical protein ACOVP4_02415 [Bacteriovoracaceae bacterium]
MLRSLPLLLLILFGVSILTGCVDSVARRQTIIPKSVIDDGAGDDDGEETEAEVRPTGAVTFKDGYCGCKAGVPTTFGNCAAFCASNNTADDLFSASFNVSAAISLTAFGSVQGWCTTPLKDAAGNLQSTNPSCVLTAKDEDGNEQDLPILTQTANSNSIKANISALNLDKTYILTLKEVTSGAKSNSIQILKPSPTTSNPLGPLKITPVSQYSCILRNLSQDDQTGDIFYENAYRLHFYFIESDRPNPIPANTSNIFCHDIFNTLYGAVDDRTYPRLEETPGVFSLWESVTDPRFFDNNGNGNLDANDQIIKKVKDFGFTIPDATNFFLKFSWPSNPTSDSSSSTSSASPLGWYMIPWIDQQTFRAYCPTQTHYNSTNVIFKAMRDIVSVDTEGLYVAMKDGELVNNGGTSSVGPADYLLIRESDIKRVWFYLNGTTPIAPTDANVASKTIYFYYPFNFNSPYVKTSTQKTYVVKRASDLSSGNVQNSGTNNGNGTITGSPPHDRRIGCVPKLQ